MPSGGRKRFQSGRRIVAVMMGLGIVLIMVLGSRALGGQSMGVLSQQVEHLIQESLGTGPYSFTFSPSELDLPDGAILNLNPTEKIQMGRNYFQMRISDGDREIQRVLTVDVTRTDSVWISARAIAPGEILTIEDVRREWLRHTHQKEEIRFKSPVGMRARHGIGSTRILTLELIEEPPVVQRGQKIPIRYRSAMMEISTVAEVREDGCAGDIIRVRVTDARKECRARVLEDGTLEVLLP
ncbi:MAG: flagellar basal body P-ring formation chaperone FlgA [Candidatus Eisenbacteria bacterium]|uniref:Flagella basal body P-ring formation protein FlgA n=1 Tax=Eiseniibacteriota bacterium TaxID=2212470 RepID=A0A948RXP3_UNCEI|nr:flagellar basal body P-ring formation chaperone FlgA [Candidatus Eisenbacteria bacterium]MBU1949318.1 flagellar basal body P-ring formation chaperone FlgA [Candidatus Eisenbacteria bacterium]MBU2692945.1 flagellar basal body P-ring formation chaperone FlgA [Candidatus Eisenbacteria bacterium]